MYQFTCQPPQNVTIKLKIDSFVFEEDFSFLCGIVIALAVAWICNL